MARTRATIEMELARVLNRRFEAKTEVARHVEHEMVQELRAELADLKAAEARQAEASSWILCGGCGSRSPFDHLFCDQCGMSFADAMEV